MVVASARARAVASATELQLHRAVADFLDVVLKPSAVWTTFPAGWGKLGKATAGTLRGCGLKPGLPDIVIFFSGRCIGIELKTVRGKVSAAQRDMFAQLSGAGIPVYLCYSVSDVDAILFKESVPVRRYRLAA